MQQYNRIFLALVLAPFVFSYSFGLDIYIPVIPEMRIFFHTSQFLIQLTMSLFLLGVGLGNLISGPITDQFGRTKFIFAATIIFIIGAIGSAIAPTIEFLIVTRIICALGSSGMLVVAFAIVRDLYSGNECAQMYSWLNAAIGLSPTFAPIIGSYMSIHYGWRAVFWFLLVIGVTALILTKTYIQETLPTHKRKCFDLTIFARYKNVLRNKVFIYHMLFAGFGVAICFSFFSVSPFIIRGLLHVSQLNFGYYFAIFGLVLALGGVISGKLVIEIGIKKTIQVGILLLFIGGGLMLAFQLFMGLHLFSFLTSMAIACLGAIFCTGSGAAGAMEPFSEYTGIASASLQAGQFTIAAIIGSTLMCFPITSSLSYAICIIIVAVLATITQCFTNTL